MSYGLYSLLTACSHCGLWPVKLRLDLPAGTGIATYWLAIQYVCSLTSQSGSTVSCTCGCTCHLCSMLLDCGLVTSWNQGSRSSKNKTPVQDVVAELTHSLRKNPACARIQKVLQCILNFFRIVALASATRRHGGAAWYADAPSQHPAEKPGSCWVL